MKLLNFREDGKLKVGLKLAGEIIDLAETLKSMNVENFPRTMHEVIESGEENIVRLVEKIEANPDLKVVLDEATIDYGPAVHCPENIICVGLNYRAHAIESNMPIPEHPILFNK